MAKLFFVYHMRLNKRFDVFSRTHSIVPSTPGKSSNRVWISLLCEYGEEDTA